MALNYITQPYVHNVDSKGHNFFVVVSCTPDIRTEPRAEVRTNKLPRSKLISGSTETSKQTTARPLHFVNTDAGNIGTRNTGRGTRDVKSHLSGHYRRWKKQQKLSLQASHDPQERGTEGLFTAVPAPKATSEPIASVTTATIVIDKAATAHQDSNSSSACSTSEDGSTPERFTKHRHVQQIGGFPRLKNALTYGNSDPFCTFPVTIDPETNRYIQLFHEGTTIMCWTKVVDQRLCDLIHFEATLHGILAVSKIISAIYLPWHQASANLLPESRHHYGELLRLMRVHFDGQASLDTKIAMEMIHAAMIFSFLAREYNGFELHFRKFKELIDGLGGIKAVDQFYSLRFLNAERIRAMFLAQKPLTNVDDWAPGSWSEQLQFRPFDQGHERGKQMMYSPGQPLLLPEGRFAQRSREIILDYRDMLSGGSVAAYLFRARQPGSDQITYWLNFRSQVLTLKTASVLADINDRRKRKPSVELTLQACACQAANLISFLIYYSYKPTIGLSYIPLSTFFKDLREVAEYIDRGHQLQHEGLYMWALFIGACAELASRTWSCEPSVRGSVWCSTKLAHMIEKLDIQTLQDFQNRLRQFLYPVLFFSYAKVLFEKRHALTQLGT